MLVIRTIKRPIQLNQEEPMHPALFRKMETIYYLLRITLTPTRSSQAVYPSHRTRPDSPPQPHS